MSVLQYIGARYVPKFYENPDDQSTDWKAGVNYEPLTIVTYNGQTYTSKKPVAGTVGNPEDNPDYWALTGEYNAAIGQLRNEVNAIKAGGVDDGSLAYDKLDQQTKDIIENNYKVIFMPNSEVSDPSNSNGMCTVIVTRKEKIVIMFDSGKAHSYAAIKQTLDDNGITHIDYFVLTHYHQDHYGNIPSLQADGYINSDTVAYLPRDTTAVPGWDVVQPTVRGYFADNTVKTISSTSPLNVDGIGIQFFNCDYADFHHYEQAGETGGNVYSICAYVRHHKRDILLITGDIVEPAISYQASLGKFRPVNVMTVPHHGMGSTGMDIFMQTAPQVCVASCGAAKEYTYANSTDGADAYLTSATIARMEALGIPCYMTGYGAVYMGISDNEYTVLSNGRECQSYNVNRQSIYFWINDSYVGTGCGTQTRPFNSLRQALAAIAELKSIGTVSLQFIGTYNHPDENVSIDVPNYLHILGTTEGGNYNVTIGSIHVYDSNVRIEGVRFANTDQHAAWFTRSRGEVRACLINGDTTALTGGTGAGICSEASDVIIGGNVVTISNRNIALAVYNGGKITALGNVPGSGNNTCIYGNNGNSVSLPGTVPSATNFITGAGDFIANSIYTLKGSVSATSPTVIYSNHHSSLEEEVFSFDENIFNGHIIRIHAADGRVYQAIRVTSGVIDLTKVQDEFTSTIVEPSFAISVDGYNVTIKFRYFVSIEIL